LLIKVLLLSLFTSFLYGVGFKSGIDYGVSNSHGYLLKQNSFDLSLGYLRVNEQIDILNIKESELSGLSAQQQSTIGDMSGGEMALRYGVNRYLSLFFEADYWAIDYFSKKLNSSRYNFFLRLNISQRRYSDSFNAVSVDLGYRLQRADDMRVSDDFILNYFLKKLRPNTSYHFEDGAITTSSAKLTLYDKYGDKIEPAVSIENLKSSSPYFRINFEKKISSRTLFNIYIGGRWTDINSKIGFYPDIDDMINIDFEISPLNRSEYAIESGIDFVWDIGGYIAELSYGYSHIYREEPLKSESGSHSVSLTLLKPLSSELLLYAGGEIFFQQFNSEIPYLYNRYTETQFDKKYGFAKVGLIYRLRGL
jgi:hypothetical protein